MARRGLRNRRGQLVYDFITAAYLPATPGSACADSSSAQGGAKTMKNTNIPASELHTCYEGHDCANRIGDFLGERPAQLLLTLASASPRRVEILKSAGYRFGRAASRLDERSVPGTGPAAVTVRIAEAKAREVSARIPGSVIIAADTSVVLDGEALGKPDSAAEARRMLMGLRGRWHEAITGVCVVAANGRLRSASATTRVSVRSYGRKELEDYLASGLPMDRAGAYGIQDRPFAPVRTYDGCYLNVVGLPLCVAADLLAWAGIVPDAGDPRCCARKGSAERGDVNLGVLE